MKSAKWWMCWAGALWLSVGCALGETETVDGIKWTYTVSGGIASLGGRHAPSPAIGAIAIPSSLGGYPVRNIWRYAFYGCSGLTSITIPDSVTNIVGGAFTGCSSLESFSVADENPTYKSVSGLLLTKDGKKLVEGVNGDVVIPGSVTNIGSDAFYGRTGLTSVVIPDSVTSIGSDAFHECNGLTSVTIGSGVKSIGSCAFSSTYGCEDFTSIFIHDLAAWCEISFEDNYSNPLAIAHHLYLDGEEVAGSLYLDGEEVAGNLVIPDGTTSIGNWAFYDCSGLTNVTIPDSVTSIGENAFWNCSGLTGLTLGNGVTNIGDSAFYGCTGLTNVAIPGSVKSIGSGAFSDCSGLTDMAIPEGVVSIREFAFSGCYGLTNVTIPDSVTSIGDDAFGGCDALDDIYTVTAEGVCILDGWVVGRIYLPFGDLDLTGIRGIADRVFSDCYGLESVTIPDGVPSIGRYAFNGCYGLTNVTIPASVTSIGDDAFGGCDGLTAVYIHDLAAWCGISFEDYTSNPLYYAGHLYLDGEEVVDLVISDGVPSIGNHAFFGCNGLTSVTIGNGVTSIGACAFQECGGLTSVTLPNSVTNIGEYAFNNCSRLATLYVPAAWEGTSILANTGLRSGCTVVYVTTKGVPCSWLDENAADILAANGGDHEAAASAAAANGRPVWECYLTGVDPAVSNQLFEATLEYDENGKLTVKWTPDLNEDGTKSERLYWVKGKKDVMDEEWSDVTDVEDLEAEGWNFFRVGVKMP